MIKSSDMSSKFVSIHIKYIPTTGTRVTAVTLSLHIRSCHWTQLYCFLHFGRRGGANSLQLWKRRCWKPLLLPSGRDSAVGRASDWKARHNTDWFESPVRQGIFLPESTSSADSLTLCVQPLVCNCTHQHLCAIRTLVQVSRVARDFSPRVNF